MLTIRKANPGDAQRLAGLAEATFRETFGPTNTAADMDLHCQANFGEAIQLGEISDDDMITLLAENDGTLIGFAQLRWGAPPGCVVAESPGEILRLYVASDWHGKGIAHDLMHASIAEMVARRSDVIWLGVWERNPRAISFYGKFGFLEVGDHVFALGHDLQRDIVMARPAVTG